MKKNKIAFAISATLLGVICYMPVQQAQAQVVTVDPAALAQMVSDSMTRMMESDIMKKMQANLQDQMGTFAEMEVDAANNAATNIVARTGKAVEEVQNLEQEERAMPAQDVCSTAKLSFSMDSFLCDTEEQAAKIEEENGASRGVATGKKSLQCPAGATNMDQCKVVDKVPSLVEVETFNAMKVNKIMDQCDALAQLAGKDVCGNASVHIAPPPQGLDPNEYDGAMLMNQIAVNLLVDPPKADATQEHLRGSSAHNKMRAADMRKSYFKESFLTALNNHTQVVHGTNTMSGRGEGVIHRFENFVKERTGNPQWLQEVTNTCPGGADCYVSPAELDRRMIQIEAVMLDVNVEQLKSSLRIERLLADIGSLMMDPVK